MVMSHHLIDLPRVRCDDPPSITLGEPSLLILFLGIAMAPVVLSIYRDPKRVEI